MLPARHGLPLDHHDHNNNNYHNNDNSDAGNDDNDNADNNNNNNATNANQSWDWKTTNTVWLSALQHFYNATTKLFIIDGFKYFNNDKNNDKNNNKNNNNTNGATPYPVDTSEVSICPSFQFLSISNLAKIEYTMNSA